jgi:hypothetical protein
MLVAKANTVIDSRGGIWTKEVVVRRRARLTVTQDNETLYNNVVVAAPGSMKFYYEHHQ